MLLWSDCDAFFLCVYQNKVVVSRATTHKNSQTKSSLLFYSTCCSVELEKANTKMKNKPFCYILILHVSDTAPHTSHAARSERGKRFFLCVEESVFQSEIHHSMCMCVCIWRLKIVAVVTLHG